MHIDAPIIYMFVGVIISLQGWILIEVINLKTQHAEQKTEIANMKNHLTAFKLLALTCAIGILSTGCASMPAALTALGQDKNNVSVRITTIYGSMTYARTGATTNGLTSVGADGTITSK